MKLHLKTNKTNILRIDLDMETKKQCIEHIWVRLAYLNDISAFFYKNIRSITLIQKKRFGCKIILKKPILINFSIHLESILGDDWRRNINVLVNYHKYNMKYYDRIFDIKFYKDEAYITGIEHDITKIISKKVNNPKRGVYFN